MNTKMLFIPILLSSLFSCSKPKDTISDYPFKERENDNWGLLSAADGKVLIEDEFKYAPTVVTDDCFFVQRANGKYELYNINNIKKVIDEDEDFVCIIKLMSSNVYGEEVIGVKVNANGEDLII